MILDILTELSADEDVKLLLTKNYDAIRAILNDADIPSLKDISSKLPDATGEQIYDLLVAALNQFKANINESAVFDNIGITPAMSVYIDGSGQIVGRSIEIGSMAVSFKMPQSGKDFALEISLNGLESMKIPQGCGITGTGTIDDGKLSGDFVAAIPGKVDGVSFRISDLDLDRLWQGYFDGKIRYDLTAMLKNSPAANVGGLSVEYGLSGEKDHTNAEFSLYMNDSKMVTLGLDCMIGQAAENIAVPSDGDTIAVDNISNIAGWLATVKFDRVFEALKNAGMDESILEYISKQFTKGLLPQ
jgi:hypothetical protein